MTMATSYPQRRQSPCLDQDQRWIPQAHPNKQSSLPSLPAQQPPWSEAHIQLSALLERMKQLEEENSWLRGLSGSQRLDTARSFDNTGLPTDSQLAEVKGSTSTTPKPHRREDETASPPPDNSLPDMHTYYRPIHYVIVRQHSKGAVSPSSRIYSAFLNLEDETVFNIYPLDALEKKIHLYFKERGFRDFNISLEETQQSICVKPGYYLMLKVHSCMKFATAIRLPISSVRITAEFQHPVENVEVWNDKVYLGSATNVNKLSLTPDWYIELSAEQFSTFTIVQFIASSGDTVLFRPQDPAESALSWSDEETKLLTEMLRGNKEFSQAAFPSRTPCALKTKMVRIRRQLRRNGESVQILVVSWPEKGYTRAAAAIVAARFKSRKPVSDVIKELPHAPKQEIHKEYLNLMKPRRENFKQDIRVFLEEGIDSQWTDIRHRFPGIGITTFLYTRRKIKEELNEEGKAEGWAKVSFRTNAETESEAG